MLGDELLTRPRLSRIYYDGKFFAYPLTAKDVIARLGIVESVLCALSYFAPRLTRRRRPQETFEDWVTARFGRRLYDAFFGSVHREGLGHPRLARSARSGPRSESRTSRFSKAVLSILGLRREHVTTLIEEFHYPRLGPGQMWEAFQRRRRGAAACPVRLDQRVTSVRHHGRPRDRERRRRTRAASRSSSRSTACSRASRSRELVLCARSAAARRGGRARRAGCATATSASSR